MQQSRPGSGTLLPMRNHLSLEDRVAAANVEPEASPVDAWRRLREDEGPHATVIDLYELVARPRGLELPLQERVTLARSVMPGVWPGFAQTDGSERGGDTIMIIDYDPGWPSRYERWRDVVRSCLGDTALGVPRQRRDVHVHVCAVGSEWERGHLLFRDYLRAHPDARDAYAAAKRQAAAMWADDGIAYIDAKTDVILTLLDAAERWSSARGVREAAKPEKMP